ncbi:MAG TPA: STAS domain-containing protein [Pseudohaliea sp.]|nr:STAS domain-containing protein [Pseudohaliea sp.]
MELNTSATVDADKDVVRVAMAGALNTETAPGFEASLDAVLAEGQHLVVLDMADLDYISSAGLRVIFKAAKQLKAEGRSLCVANRQAQIAKVFEILQALPDMRVFASDRELDAYLDAMQARVRGEPD